MYIYFSLDRSRTEHYTNANTQLFFEYSMLKININCFLN